MTTTMNWQLRDHMHRFREEPGEGRECCLDVLLYLILRANVRGRTWVSRDKIANDTGIAKSKVSSALQWLFDKGAIYNVPYKYRVGVERDLEPRKYVFQLTGIIRFNENLVVPYLYLPDSEKEIANTLRELSEIGGESLVTFLTHGSDSEPDQGPNSGHSPFGKRSESDHSGFGQRSELDRSELDRSELDHKDSTALKDFTEFKGKTSSYREPDGPRQTEKKPYLPDYAGNSIRGLQLDKTSRQGEKLSRGDDDHGEEQIIEDAPDYTPFELWLLAACYNTKKLTERQRNNFHIRVPYLDAQRQAVNSPTVNEAWDADPTYRAFVQDVILLELQSRRQLHPTGFYQTLNSKKTWERFYAWRKAHEDEYSPQADSKREEDGRKVLWPDGGSSWVPYSQSINDAYQEYLRGKEQ